MRKGEIRKRKKRERIDDLPLLGEEKIDLLAKTLARQVEAEVFRRKYAPVASILKIVGAGAFLAASVAFPTLPQAIKPFLKDENEYEVWKRFNIPYLKRTLKRLAKEKLVEIGEEEDRQIVKITDRGRRRILKYALEEIEIKKPKFWDGRWRLVSFDLPQEASNLRKFFVAYLKAWGFYPLHESVYLHAYPCEREVEFLREYLGIGEYVRIFIVAKIEDDKTFREFFGV